MQKINVMRKDLYTFIHWAIAKALKNHPGSTVSFVDLIKITENVWKDMIDNGEFEDIQKSEPIKKRKPETKPVAQYASEFFKQSTEENLF